MSPFYQSKNKGLPINGTRPTPLRINKNSNHITKMPLKKPIIIYAKSPKVIHTRPQDFMALVQRLTGFSSSRSRSQDDELDHHLQQSCDYDEHGYSSSSGLSSDDQKIINVNDCINIKEENDNIDCYLVSPTMFMPSKKASIGDIPLYTPTGLDWICSSSSYNSSSLS